jgi:hypothetical protein
MNYKKKKILNHIYGKVYNYNKINLPTAFKRFLNYLLKGIVQIWGAQFFKLFKALRYNFIFDACMRYAE